MQFVGLERSGLHTVCAPFKVLSVKGLILHPKAGELANGLQEVPFIDVTVKGGPANSEEERRCRDIPPRFF